MIAIRKLSPGGYEYLTGSTACHDRHLELGESLSDYYLAHGYPPGMWFGRGAEALGVSGEVTREQMNALFGEGRHPLANKLEADLIAAGRRPAEAMKATQLGYRFAQFGSADKLRSAVIDAYKQHNIDQGRPIGAPIDDAVRAGIRREVQERFYAAEHDGNKPSAKELTDWLREQKRAMKSAVAGYELVVAPPKSVSVAWALSDAATRELIVGLHRQAVANALAYFENNVAFTRRGAGGIAQYDVRGIAAVTFEHWDSRSADPHLHTHVPISTKVQGPDGRWTSLDGRTVLAAAVTVSEFYNSRIRDLFREHGARWSERPAGGIDAKRPVWELDGVPDELLLGFSKRAAQVEADRARRIVAYRQKHGHEPGPKEMLELARLAQYGTRDPKQAPRSLAEHVRRWRAEAATMLPDATVLRSLRDRIFGGEPEPVSEASVADLAQTTRLIVSDSYSHFNVWNLEAEAHRQTAHLTVEPGSRARLIAAVVEAVLTDSEIVALQAPSLVDEPPALRRESGESVFDEHNAARFTTRQTLREESALAAWGRRRDGYRISEATVRRALSGSGLNAGQQLAVAQFARSGRRVQLLYAAAGTGKTTTMKVFADAWRSAGGRVFAFGPSARAAQELAQSIDARPHTLHQVTTALRMGVAEKAFPFKPGDVLIIDEIGMAGTHTLHAVVRYALRRGADVRWVGDDHQLAAVEAGGAVRWFAMHNGTLRLREVVRFHDRYQAAASILIREGTAAGLKYYFDQGWIAGGSRETIRDAAHTAWRADLDAGRQSLLIVPTNEDVAALNLQARELRLGRGDVSAGRSVQLHDGTSASRGDWVVTRHNDRLKTLFGGRDFVKNGDTWTVEHVRRDGSIRVRHQESGGAIVLPSDYVSDNVELAYASTVNRVQGMTSKGSAHAIVPQGLSREQLYTMLTRAIHENYLYPETHKHTIDSHQETPNELTERGVLEAALARSSVETSANEELLASQGQAQSLRTLVARANYVAQIDLEDRIETVLTELVPELMGQAAMPALRQTLRSAAELGWQVEPLVSAALAEGRLTRADDPAAVLQWRIEQRVIRDRPPEPTASPTLESMNRWRTIIELHDPTAMVDTPAWQSVWQRLAAATAEGLDANATADSVGQRLASRPRQDPVPDHQFAITVVDDHLARLRAAGAGWHPVLPWLAHPDHAQLAEHPDLADFHRRLQEAIATRATELLAAVIAEPPNWTAGLGDRPLAGSALAERWDQLAGLAAAFRDTFGVTDDDARFPLGPEPDGQSLRARAWRDLIGQWAPPAEDQHRPVRLPADKTAEHPHERLRNSIDPDELLAVVAAADESTTVDVPAEDLANLVGQYVRSAGAATDHAFRERVDRLLNERLPQALGQPAEPALRWILRQAWDLGWPIEGVVPDVTALRRTRGARDPAAVLYRRVEQRMNLAEPPDQPMSAAPLRPLPWLEPADPAVLAGQPEMTDHLDRLADRITDRAAELRAQIAAEQPAWTAGLGPRPAEPAAAKRWDNLAGLAGAYRETYRITTTSPKVPLGPKPSGDTARTRAWQEITDQWRPTVSAPEQFTANQQAIDALLDQLNQEHLDVEFEARAEAALDDAEEADSHDVENDEDLGDSTGLGSGLGL